MNTRLTFHVMAFLWTYLAITGALVQWDNAQPHDVTFEIGATP